MTSNTLDSFRLEILKCHKCFSENKCRHHEDLVGGYETGKTVFIGINPQAGKKNDFYGKLEQQSPEYLMDLGDHLLKIFNGAPPPETLPNRLVDIHPGMKWFGRVATCLGLTKEQVEENLRFVELFKHASADTTELMKNPNWKNISHNCPSWLIEQIQILAPKQVIFSGSFGLRFATDVLKLKDLPVGISNAHGQRRLVKIGSWEGPALFTYAISRQTLRLWRLQPLADALSNASQQGSTTPPPSPVITTASLYLVTSAHENINWKGIRSEGVRAQGYSNFLHVLELSDDLVNRIADAPCRGRGGRKYGPTREESRPFACFQRDQDAWFVSTNPAEYFPDVLPRIRPRLINGRPRALSCEELDLIL